MSRFSNGSRVRFEKEVGAPFVLIMKELFKMYVLREYFEGKESEWK